MTSSPALTQPVRVHPVLADPAITALPDVCREKLAALLTELRDLTPDALCWVAVADKLVPEATKDDAWDTIWQTVRRACREEARGRAMNAARDGAPVTAPRAARAVRNAASACTLWDILPPEAALFLDIWEEGLLLAQWAQSASAPERETCSVLAEDWEGSVPALIAAASEVLVATA